MPAHVQAFYASENADRWSLGWCQETAHLSVPHEANAAAGGHRTDYGIDAFMTRDLGSAEYDALLRVLRTPVNQ